MRPEPEARGRQRPNALGPAAVALCLSAPAVAEAAAAAPGAPGWLAWSLLVPALIAGVAIGLAAARRRRGPPLDPLVRQASEIDPGRADRRFDAGGDESLAPLVNELNRMVGRLEAGLAARDRFTSEIAHELKTPVSVLLLEAQVVARTEPDPKALARFVSSVEEEMRRLSKLIESFLMLARMDYDSAAPRRVSTDMNEIALEAGEHCWPAARLRDLGLAVSLDSAADDSPIVEGIPDLLRTMIENLLRNAIAVSPRHSNIQMQVARDDGAVVVAVRDRGPGVPEAIAGRIFERFVSGTAPVTGMHGSGIGLTIARGIARVHGGEVRFRNLPSAEGGGAEFSARIPLRNGTDEPETTPAPTRQ